jgi:hypothetical protein
MDFTYIQIKVAKLVFSIISVEIVINFLNQFSSTGKRCTMHPVLFIKVQDVYILCESSVRGWIVDIWSAIFSSHWYLYLTGKSGSVRKNIGKLNQV